MAWACKSYKIVVASLMFFLLFCSSSAVAWSDHIRVINNSNAALSYVFSPKKHSGAHPSSGVIDAMAQGESVALTDGDWWSSDGDLTIRQGDLECTYHYHGIANKHSLTELRYQAGPERCRQVALLTDNAEHDCNGPHNCLIFSDDAGWAAQALALQSDMADTVPLNQHQFVATHNSAVSTHYIKNGIDDLVALNQSLSLTEQLNAGVRSLELDVVYSNKDFRICHFHTDSDPDLLCFNNASLRSVLGEVRQWLDSNPHQVVMLYLDVNHPLSNQQVQQVDQMLQGIFSARLYTVADAYGLPLAKESNRYAQPLPVAQISFDKLRRLGKQVIVSAHKEFDNSPQVFMHVLNDTGLAGYLKGGDTCQQRDVAAFADSMHHTLWRINGDRSLASAVVKESDYITVESLWGLKQCPLNLYSMDKLQHNDARLVAQVWSWQPGFPLPQTNVAAKPYAILSAATGRLQNKVELPDITSVLCYQASTQQWQALMLPSEPDVRALVVRAKQVCRAAGAVFAAPINSYQMMAARLVVTQPTLVNLLWDQGWHANQGLDPSLT